MDWSNEQKMAIENSTPIVVSAGAGSGKTAVLTERIYQLIKIKKIPLSKMLVLTFTNAAALEMKMRVAKKLTGDNEKTKEVLEALDYIDQANITTFDAYSLKIVKKYGYLLGLSNDIEIADSAVINKVFNQLFDELLEKYYANDDFCKIADDFVTKNDKEFKECLIRFYRDLEYNPNIIEFLNDAKNNYTSDKFKDKLIKIYLDKKSEIIEEIENEISLLEEYRTDENSKKVDKNISILRERLEYGKCSKRFASIDDDDFEELYKKVKDKIDINYAHNFLLNENQINDIIINNFKYFDVLIDFFKEFNELYLSFKDNNNLNTFSDIARKSIKILKNFKWVRDEIKNNTLEILIDEYQDTSDIQDAFISLIENNNTYYVGDMKQAIYGFRGANPSIFKSKIEKISPINLTNNFRSRNEVLQCVNKAFRGVMTDEYGGVLYNKDHELNYGFKRYDDGINNDYEAMIYTYDGKPSSEAEIDIIINDILKKVDNYEVYDKSNNCFRRAKYCDFAILIASKKLFDSYLERFNEYKIPLNVINKQKFYQSDEIYAIFSLFKYSVDRNRLSGYSVLRSFLFDYNDSFDDNFDELNKIIDEVKEKSRTAYELLEGLVFRLDTFHKLTRLDDYELRRMKIYKLLNVSKAILNIEIENINIYEYFDYIENEFSDYEFDAVTSNPNAVQIMSIHNSKGLEFPICYFPDLFRGFNKKDDEKKILFDKDYGFVVNTKLFVNPFKNYVIDIYKRERISEKLRLFYVALTRAREKIIMICPKSSLDINPKNDSHNAFEIKDSSCFCDFLRLANNIKKINADPIIEFEVKDLESSIKKSNELIEIKEIEYKKEAISAKIASHQVNQLITDNEKYILKTGIRFHKYFEIIDFFNYLESIESLNLNNNEKKIINKFFNQINLNGLINTYKEHYFKYKDNNIEKSGIIDLILEYNDSIKIIDYKLSDTSKDYYIDQLRSYRDYLKTIFNKKIDVYLYSIMKGEIKEICLE